MSRASPTPSDSSAVRASDGWPSCVAGHQPLAGRSRWCADRADAATRPVAGHRPRAGRQVAAAARRIRSPLRLGWRIGLGAIGVAAIFARLGGARRGGSTMPQSFLVPTPAATWDAFAAMWRDGTLGERPRGRRCSASSSATAISVAIGDRGRHRHRHVRRRRRRSSSRRSASCATSRPARSRPLLLLWLGIGESPKISLIVVGTVFFNILMIADVARAVPRELLNASYTLGAGRWTTVRKVIIPHSVPGIIDVARINLAAAWLMLVVAELLAAQEGLAFRIVRAQRFRGRRHDVRPADRVRRHRPRQRPAAAPAALVVAVGQAVSARRRERPREAACVDARDAKFVRPRPATHRWRLDGVSMDGRHAGELVCLLGLVGLRQVDAAEHHRRARRGDRRRGARRRRAGRRAGRRSWHGVPGLLAVPVAHGRREHRLRAGGRRGRAGSAPGAGQRAARDHGPHRVRRQAAPRAVGRHAPARRHRPGAGPGARRAAARRAVRRPRRPDPPVDAGLPADASGSAPAARS